MFELLTKSRRRFRYGNRRTLTEPVYRDTDNHHRGSGIGIFGNILLLALILFVSSTAMLAWQVGDNAQVNAYSAYRRSQHAFYSSLPHILTGLTADTTTPIQLITEGVAKVIVDTTLSYTDAITKTEPMIRLIKDLDALETVYVKHVIALTQAIDSNILDMNRKLWFTNYIYDLENRIAILKDDLSTLKKPFLARTSTREFYEYKSTELPRLIAKHETSIEDLHVGDIDTVLKAFGAGDLVPNDTMDYVKSKVRSIRDEITRNYDTNKYSVGIMYHSSGTTTIRLGPSDFEEDFKMIDERLDKEMFEYSFPEVILDLIRNQLKMRIISLSLESIRMVSMNEKAKSTWKQISNEFKSADVVINEISAAINTIIQSCMGKNTMSHGCQLKSQLQYLPDILREFTIYSLHLPSPEKLLETIIRENCRKNPKLVSFQDILLLKDIEEFRRKPNIWISLTAISSGLAIGTFVSAIIFGLGYSMLYGIIGSIMNVAGIVFDTTSVARKRFQANGKNNLRLTAIKGYHKQICDLADLQKTIKAANFTDISLPSRVFEELDEDDLTIGKKTEPLELDVMNLNPLLLTADNLR